VKKRKALPRQENKVLHEGEGPVRVGEGALGGGGIQDKKKEKRGNLKREK